MNTKKFTHYPNFGPRLAGFFLWEISKKNLPLTLVICSSLSNLNVL